MKQSNTMLFLVLLAVLGLLSPGSLIAQAQQKPDESKKADPAPAFTPTSDYNVRKIEGWRVLVNPQFEQDKKLHKAVIAELRLQLYRIRRRLPVAALAKVREIPIWVERKQHFPDCMCYHEIGTTWLAENRLNPDKAGAVDLGNARNFLDWTQHQPWMVLHELAHGFHDRLPDRFKNADILATYKRARAADLYGRVQHIGGRMTDHYAANNQMEYFAEASEAFLGRNDFYPFVRSEFKQYDPHGFKLLKKIWGFAEGDNYFYPAATLPDTMPWNLAQLSDVPQYEWLDEKGEVRSLTYRGEPFEGRTTRVFAYYATPGTLAGDTSRDVSLPAVVLVHGGGGAAFPEWVKLWARRGYAAIAMDLAGRGADRQQLPQGGPDQTDQFKFGRIDQEVTEQWTYHAVANVVRAHSLLRSFPEVDSNRTGLTGISWGGYLTCIVAGIDRRFKAAVPVYGCGFLDESSTWLPQFEKMTAAQRDRWVKLWDPSRYVGSAGMPIFFMNGTNDGAYWLDSYAKTYGLVAAENRNVRVTVNMPHSHPAGWAPKEIGLFVDHHLRGAAPLPKLLTPVADDDGVRTPLQTTTAIKAANLHYTTDKGAVNKRRWKTIAAKVQGDHIVADAPPKQATIWFLTVTDEREAIVSSEVVFTEPAHK